MPRGDRRMAGQKDEFTAETQRRREEEESQNLRARREQRQEEGERHFGIEKRRRGRPGLEVTSRTYRRAYRPPRDSKSNYDDLGPLDGGHILAVSMLHL